MAEKGLKVVVFLSSVRPGRMADRIAKYLKVAIVAKGMTPVVLDPLEMQIEVVQVPLHFMQNPSEAPEWLKEANETIKSADAFIIASAEYNCSLPPALSNMMDYFPPASFRNRPVGIITYSLGPFGGIRAATLLRAFTVEFGMLPVPTGVPIPTISGSISSEGEILEERISKNIGKLLDEIRWYATAIKNHSKVEPPPNNNQY